MIECPYSDLPCEYEENDLDNCMCYCPYEDDYPGYDEVEDLLDEMQGDWPDADQEPIEVGSQRGAWFVKGGA